MTPKQAEGLRNALKGLVVACDRVNLHISKCNTRDLDGRNSKIIFWLRRFVVGTREQGVSHLKKVDELIDNINQTEQNHE